MLKEAPGILAHVEFTLHPAIRKAQADYIGPNCSTWECPDETCGCPMTRWAVCALANKTQAQQLSWLGCWDQSRVLWSSKWVLKPPETDALQCVNNTAPDTYLAVKSCGEGSEADDLLAAAADYFHQTFPAFWTGQYFSVPKVYIDNIMQDVNRDGTDLWRFVRAICNGGANAAVCNALSTRRTISV